MAVGTTNNVMIKASDSGYTIADAVKFTEVVPSGTTAYFDGNKQIFFDFINQREEFLVYPNPAERILSITTDKSFNNSDFKLYDMSGRVVLNGNITNLKTDISVTDMPRGMYVLEFGNSFKRVKKKIILK